MAGISAFRTFPETSKLDTFNRNGARMCDAFGCRCHKKLQEACGGLFCRRHVRDIRAIRARIDHSGSMDELLARQEELRFRKQFHAPHVVYTNVLAQQHLQ